MAKTKRMDQIKNISHTYQHCRSIKGTARRLGVSKNTVREYVRRIRQSPHDEAAILRLPEAALDWRKDETDFTPEQARQYLRYRYSKMGLLGRLFKNHRPEFGPVEHFRCLPDQNHEHQ